MDENGRSNIDNGDGEIGTASVGDKVLVTTDSQSGRGMPFGNSPTDVVVAE